MDKQPTWSHTNATKMVDNSVAQYTGSIITTEKDLSSSSLGLAEGQMFPELAHLVIGLEGVSHQVTFYYKYEILEIIGNGIIQK